jgi:hypothetical protein
MTAFRIILIFSILISATSEQANAQRRYKLNPMNAVYGELFIITPDQSFFRPALNYERLFSPKSTFSGRIGIIPDINGKIMTFPLTLQGHTAGRKQHHIEYGGGVMTSVDYYQATEKIVYIFYPVLMGGYRYEKGTGLMFRATANIIIHKTVYLNPSVSVGYLF